jgi:hypothetical protein
MLRHDRGYPINMAELTEEVLSLELPCDPTAPAAARTALGRDERFGWVTGDVQLVASELVTHAVLRSGCEPRQQLRLTATVDSGSLRILVEDPGVSAGSSHLRQLSELTDGGVGLMIVDKLVERWGAERDGGYRVWAELELDPAAVLAGTPD